MKSKALIPLIAGLGVGGLAIKMGWSTLQNARGAQPEMAQVWGVKEPVSRGSAIDEALLVSLKFPAQFVPAGAFRKKEELVGRVARTELPVGLPVLENLLFEKGTPPGLHVPPGLRAVAVKVDESSSVDYHIEPGSHVDVVGFFSTRREGKQEVVARTLVENVQVAAVGQKIAPGADDSEKAANGKGKQARAVVLLVKPEYVPKLHLAEQRGKIKLSMRGEVETAGQNKPVSSTEEDILGPSGPTKGGLGNFLAMLASKPAEPPQAKPEPEKPAVVEVKPQPEPPAAKPPAWVMAVWNGADRKVMGWQSMNSIEGQVIETAPAGEKNPAPEARKSPAPTPEAKPEKPAEQTTDKPEKPNGSEQPTEPEPEELPE